MKITFLKPIAFFAIGAMLAMPIVGCSDDNDEPGEDPVNPDDPDVPTVVDDKEFLENTASEFMRLFNAADQQPIVDLANEFVDMYGDYELPDEFDWYETPSEMLKKLSSTLTNKKYGALMASYTYYYTWDFVNYAGVYEPGRNYYWEKVEDSDDIVFRYKNRTGETCNITVKASAEVWTTVNDVDGDIHTLNMPKQLNVTITKGTKEMLNTTLKSNFVENESLELSLASTFCNIAVDAKLQATNTQITHSSTLKVDGETVLTGSATVTGRSFCNKDFIRRQIENGTEDVLLDYVDKGDAQADMLGKLQIKGTVTELRRCIDAYDVDVESDNNRTVPTEVKNAATTLNNNFIATAYYNGTSQERAKLVWQPISEGYDSYYWWWVDSALLFPDGTTYAFEEYFEDGSFDYVADTFENLLNAYSSLWK
ncbi:MAG: hypothetical protein ACI31A_08330 [Candidatus Limisoma sp.]